MNFSAYFAFSPLHFMLYREKWISFGTVQALENNTFLRRKIKKITLANKLFKFTLLKRKAVVFLKKILICHSLAAGKHKKRRTGHATIFYLRDNDNATT